MQGRNTKNKESIIKVFEEKHLLTIKELSDILSDIDFSTIYRNVKKFKEEGLLNEVNINSDTITYELKRDFHDHFICNSCNGVESIKLDPEDIKQKLPKGFKVNIGQNIIRGLCGKCN